MKVNFASRNKGLTFDDLKTGDTFRVLGGTAVYTKVRLRPSGSFGGIQYAAMDFTTATVFPKTLSNVELVDVTVNIND